MTVARRTVLASVLTIVSVLTACTSDDDPAVDDTVADTTTTTVADRAVGDGQLVIGALLPRSNSAIGEPAEAAIELAIERINAAGGVLGRPVQLVAADEGDTTATASAAIERLLGNDVDAIIGPASSLIALSTLDTIVAAGRVACSPTASALALDEFPDDGLFFRTVPSDSLQAQAIAEAADQTGAQRVTVVFADDAYGRPFADAVETALAGAAIPAAGRIPISPDDDDLSDEAAQLAGSDAQAMIVLADGDTGTRFLEALDAENTDDLAIVVVNDAFRNPSAAQRIMRLDPAFRAKIVGLAPQADSGDPAAPFDPPGPYATNAYDCANLIALAAIRAQSDVPREIAGQLAPLSVSGSVCTSFADCMETIEAGLQIDYDGPSGLTDLQTRTGDPARATFDRFTFDDAGRDVLERSITVGS